MFQGREFTYNLRTAFIDKGRLLMRDGKAEEAQNTFSFSRIIYAMVANWDGEKAHEVTPFAVHSNRATLSEALGDYYMCRFDSRCTLASKPDHFKTYTRIPNILKRFGCKALISEAEELLEEAKDLNSSEKKDDQNAWIALSKRGIFLTSLRTIILSKTGKLTDDARRSIMETGIEDMYGRVTYTYEEVPPLPWLKPKDMDPRFSPKP